MTPVLTAVSRIVSASAGCNASGAEVVALVASYLSLKPAKAEDVIDYCRAYHVLPGL